MVPNNTRDLSGEINALEHRLAAPRIRTHVLPQNCFIRQRPPYRDAAGRLIAYAAQSDAKDFRDLREEVDALGDEIADRIGAVARGWVRK
jgi:hypothetical protein